MTVKIKKLNDNFKMPVKAHKDDFCYDVFAASEEEIAPGVWKYGLGFALQLSPVANIVTIYDIDFRSRSSIHKTGMVLSNSVGTIDAGYTGEISAVFYHVMPNLPRYKVGDKIGQIKIGATLPIDFRLVESLEDTERGTGGFGSSGN